MPKTESKSIQDKKDREARGSKYQSTFGKEKNTKRRTNKPGTNSIHISPVQSVTVVRRPSLNSIQSSQVSPSPLQ